MVLDEVTDRISDELRIVDVVNDVDVVVVTVDGDFVAAVIVDFKDVVACVGCSGVDKNTWVNEGTIEFISEVLADNEGIIVT